MNRGQLALLILTGLAVKSVLMLTTEGTIDAAMWDTSATQIRSVGGASVYMAPVIVRAHPTFSLPFVFNHPPLMVHVLSAAGWLAERTGIRVRQWVRLACVLADIGTILLLSRLATKILNVRSIWPLVAVALSPVQLLISGFHTNTDPIMMFFVVSAIYFAELRCAAVMAGLAMGAALCIKVVPLILLPLMIAWLPSWKARLQFLGCAAGLWFAASLPWVFLVPREIATGVLGYSPTYGAWGLSEIAIAMRGWIPWFNVGFAAAGKHVAVGFVAALGVVLARRYKSMPLFCQCGVAMFAFLFLTPGFGVQYLAWLTPWLVALPPIVGGLYALQLGVFLSLTYLSWQGGTVRGLTDRLTLGHLAQLLPAMRLVAWLSVLACVGVILRSRFRSAPPVG